MTLKAERTKHNFNKQRNCKHKFTSSCKCINCNISLKNVKINGNTANGYDMKTGEAVFVHAN